jgi:hypothetical protein
VVHEHTLSCKVIVETEDLVEFVGFFCLQLPTAVGQAGEWQVMLLDFVQGL